LDTGRRIRIRTDFAARRTLAPGTPMISVEPAATATARTASNVRWIQTPEHRTDQGAFGSRRALASAPNRETSNQATVA